MPPPSPVRGVFVGSGSDGLQQPAVAKRCIDLTRKAAADVTVLYLGTATYDIAAGFDKQTVRFAELGCTVTKVDVTLDTDDCSRETLEALFRGGDIVVVSGGNTLFAVDRWVHLGVDTMLKEAAARGCVLTGGSAGAICWFDGGHSDSADPDTYKAKMLAAASSADKDKDKDEASAAPEAGQAAKEWAYIRCPCLGILPGLVVRVLAVCLSLLAAAAHPPLL